MGLRLENKGAKGLKMELGVWGGVRGRQIADIKTSRRLKCHTMQIVADNSEKGEETYKRKTYS